MKFTGQLYAVIRRVWTVILMEWLDYATGRVPQTQTERLDAANSSASPQPSASTSTTGTTAQGGRRNRQLVQEELDPSTNGVQRPRVFYRREQEARPLVIARP